MTKPTVVKGEEIAIKFGDGDDPEVFATKCMINADRDITFNASTQQESVPDCTNPGDPAWVDTVVDELSADVSGSGKWDMSTDAFLFDMYTAGTPVNAKVQVGGTGGPIYSGALVCTKYSISGTPKRYATGSLAFQFSGAVTRTTAS